MSFLGDVARAFSEIPTLVLPRAKANHRQDRLDRGDVLASAGWRLNPFSRLERTRAADRPAASAGAPQAVFAWIYQ